MLIEAALVLSFSSLLQLAPAPAAAGRAPPAGSPAAAPEADGTVLAADGVKIRYHVEGAAGRPGRPALVFVHCWSCDRHLWDGEVAFFAPRYRVVTLDLAGHGDSGRDRKAWTIPAFAGDVRRVVENLGLERVVLIGHSMGGDVVVEAAGALGRAPADGALERVPRRVAGVVLVDTLLDVDQARPDAKQLAQFFDPLRADYKSAVETFVRSALLLPTTDPALADRIVRQTASRPPEIGIAALEGAFAYDPRPALRGLTMPIHAINGTRYPTNVAGFRRYAPQFQVTFLPGTGHYLMLEAPRRFDALLDGVLAEMAAPPPAN